MFICTNVMLTVWHLIWLSECVRLEAAKRTCNSSPTMELLQALFTSEASLTFVDFLPLAEEI